MRSRQLLCLPVAVILVIATGCEVRFVRDTDTTATHARGDDGAAPGRGAGPDSVYPPSSSGDTMDSAQRSGIPASDSLVGVAPRGAVAPPGTAPAGATGAGAATDTGAIIATPAELRALASVMQLPVQGVRAADLHDTFDERRGGGSRPHEALDILAPRGTPVLSATAGTVLKKHASVPGGLMVYAADAGDRFILMYGHLDRYTDGLADGQALARGQLIGYVGTTGNAPAGTPHLHFAVARGRPSRSWWRGTPVNPYPLLTGAAP